MEENWGRQTCGAQPARRRPTVGGIYRTKAIAVVIAVLVLVILAMGFMYSARYGAEKTYQSNTVQFGLRSIGELATQAGYFTSVQSISGSREVFGVTVPFTQSKYVYSYDGIVKAGVHFEQLEIMVDEQKKIITVTLPHAEILDVTVDETSLVVYDENKNIFSPLLLGDIQGSMLAMKADVQSKAEDNGILVNAEANAELMISGFLSGAYPASEYTVQFIWNEREEAQTE